MYFTCTTYFTHSHLEISISVIMYEQSLQPCAVPYLKELVVDNIGTEEGLLIRFNPRQLSFLNLFPIQH